MLNQTKQKENFVCFLWIYLAKFIVAILTKLRKYIDLFLLFVREIRTSKISKNYRIEIALINVFISHIFSINFRICFFIKSKHNSGNFKLFAYDLQLD